MADLEPFELEPPGGEFSPTPDQRPRMPEPPPVRLVAVADIMLPANVGLERELDEFYIGLLQFERDTPAEQIIYRAENFRILFELHESLVTRDSYRPLQVEIKSLPEAELKLIDLEWEFVHQRGLQPGVESLLLNDPAGNPIELLEFRPIM